MQNYAKKFIVSLVSLRKKMNKSIIKGSLSAIAAKNNVSLAETFMNCDVLLLVDMSSSMGTDDAPGGIERYEAAERDVIRLQETHQGKVAVVVFANYPLFCPSGKPERLGGGTQLANALEFIKPIDDTGVKIVLISDGEPFDPEKCLKVARTFRTKIDVVFVGNTEDKFGGKQFLEKLARATGGEYFDTGKPGELFLPVERLMLMG
jgi:Mg-chelatase subunit ChlD